VPAIPSMAIAIDQLLAAYETDLRTSAARFFRQNTNRYERNHVDRHGHVTNAFLAPHNFKSLPPIREAILGLLFDSVLQRMLAEATGFDRFHLMPSMLLDKNAETPPHQDLRRLRHSEWLSLMADCCAANQHGLVASAMRKGDVSLRNDLKFRLKISAQNNPVLMRSAR
jgi:hypothetical protein